MAERDFRLQLRYKSADKSPEAQVLSYLLDRDVVSASSCRELVSQALVAWLSCDAVTPERTESEYRSQLIRSIAGLQGRLTYCKALLAELDSQPHSQSPDVLQQRQPSAAASAHNTSTLSATPNIPSSVTAASEGKAEQAFNANSAFSGFGGQ